jgi:putative membrane protein
MEHKRYFLLLSIIFIIEFIVISINPYNRADWALENVLVVLSVIFVVFTYKKCPLSRLSYSLIFIFMSLHEIGSYYTYSNVPYDEFLLSYFNVSLNEYMGWNRNNFDRLIHFAYGFLLAYPVRDLYCKIAAVKGFWSYFTPLNLIMSTSMLYELVEWGAAEVFGGELGMAYLGTQGDIWDAHKDMALASLGGLLAMVITLLIHSRIQKDFREQWRLSLTVNNKGY